MTSFQSDGDRNKNKELYNANFFSEDPDSYKPGVLQKKAGFLHSKPEHDAVQVCELR